MPNVDLGEHFDRFVEEQLASGRFQNASEVVQAGLSLLERQEISLAARRQRLLHEVNQAFDDPRPSIPAEEAFARLRAHHAAQDRFDRNGG